MKLYIHTTRPKLSRRLVADLNSNGYTLVAMREVAGTPSPARVKQRRMYAMLEADAVVFGSDVKGLELLRLRANCIWSGLRLIPLKDLPQVAPEIYRELNAVSIAEPMVEAGEDRKLGDLSIRELERLKRATEKDLRDTPVLSELHKARSRMFRAITDRLVRIGGHVATTSN